MALVLVFALVITLQRIAVVQADLESAEADNAQLRENLAELTVQRNGAVDDQTAELAEEELNIDALEDAIVALGNEQRPDLAPWTVACPEVPEPFEQGDQFVCTATAADGLDYEATITAMDHFGNVDINF